MTTLDVPLDEGIIGEAGGISTEAPQSVLTVLGNEEMIHKAEIALETMSYLTAEQRNGVKCTKEGIEINGICIAYQDIHTGINDGQIQLSKVLIHGFEKGYGISEQEYTQIIDFIAPKSLDPQSDEYHHCIKDFFEKVLGYDFKNDYLTSTTTDIKTSQHYQEWKERPVLLVLDGDRLFLRVKHGDMSIYSTTRLKGKI